MAALLSAGRVPLVRAGMREAVDTLRHEQIEAILVDTTSAELDALEFVLNVRDINESVPILVVASDDARRDLRAAVGELSGVWLAEPELSPQQVVDELERIALAGEEHSRSSAEGV